MILTQCAVCATELGLSLGKKCGRCSTRYCGPECQKKHWEEGGHDQLCKKIKKAGGAEQYNANTKYAEAVGAAAEACAEDTKGETCFICTQALHWKTKEGLVRGCSCRGTAGIAHVSCLTEQAKILFAEAEENNLDPSVMEERFQRWYSCSLCEQEYHGVVKCALGWACWKTYLGRPDGEQMRIHAMNILGTGLHAAGHYEDELPVRETELAMRRRLGDPEELILVMQGNLAGTHHQLGRSEEALRIRQDVYSGYSKLFGKEHEETLREASNYAATLKDLRRFEEAKALLRRTIPVARRALGASHITTLRVQWIYAQTLYKDDAVTLDDLREAVTTLEEIERTARRVLGGGHPTTEGIEECLQDARVALNAGVRSAAVDALVAGGAKLIVP